MTDTLEQVTIRKVAWWLLPFLFLMLIWCVMVAGPRQVATRQAAA
jgi:hypothetical protein